MSNTNTTTDNDFQQRLNDIETTFNLATEEYISNYPKAKMNPGVKSYQLPLQNAVRSINEANAELFSIESELNGNIEKYGNSISVSNNYISDLKTTNKVLEQNVDDIKGSDKGSIKRYRNSQRRSFLDLYSSIALAVAAYFTFNKMRAMYQ